MSFLGISAMVRGASCFGVKSFRLKEQDLQVMLLVPAVVPPIPALLGGQAIAEVVTVNLHRNMNSAF